MQCPFHKSPEFSRGIRTERYSDDFISFIKCLNDFGFIYGDLPEGISDIDNFVGFIKDGLIARGILSSQAEVRAIIIRDAFLSGQIINAYFLHNYPDLQINKRDIKTFFNAFISDQNLRLILEHLLILKGKIYSTVTSIELNDDETNVYKKIQSKPSYTKLVEIIKRLSSGSISTSDLLKTFTGTVRDEIRSALNFQLTTVPNCTLMQAYRSKRLKVDSLGNLKYDDGDDDSETIDVSVKFPSRIDIGGGVKLTGEVINVIRNKYELYHIVFLTGGCPIRVWFRI
jgi:hypothetical protein